MLVKSLKSAFNFISIWLVLKKKTITYVTLATTLLSHNFDRIISLKNQVGLDATFSRGNLLSYYSYDRYGIKIDDRFNSTWQPLIIIGGVFVIDAVFMFATCLNRDALESTFEEHLYRASSRDTRVRILRIFAYMTRSTNVHPAGYVSRVRNTREHRFLPLDHSGTRHRNTL